MGEGERAEAARRRRVAMLIIVSLAVALAMIVGTAIFQQGHGRITPGWAIAFVTLFLAAMLGSWRFARRVSDEVERRDTIGSLALGGAIYALVYPAWYFLWRGGLVAEPSHEAMFVIFFIATMTAYLWKKIR